jgi:hypothetical protein
MIQLIINDILKLQYSSNTFDSKEHEDEIKNILINRGFSEAEVDTNEYNTMRIKDNKLKNIDTLKGKYLYIEQPFGSQNAPDFITCIDGLVLWIECKSGKGKITWNAGFPRKDVLYAFSCKKENHTTVFFGQSTELLKINPNFENAYNQFDKELKIISNNLFGDTFKCKTFDFYMRRMLNDKTKYGCPEVRNTLYTEVQKIIESI